MKAKLKYLLYGILLGIFFSGLLFVLIGAIKNKNKTSIQSLAVQSKLQVDLESDLCMNNQSNESEIKKVDLNNSTTEELNSLPGIGEVKAKSIVDFRQKYGNFVSVDELLYVPGIGDNLFQQICALISVNP